MSELTEYEMRALLAVIELVEVLNYDDCLHDLVAQLKELAE